MDHPSPSLSTDIASKSLTTSGAKVDVAQANRLDGRDGGMQCPSGWLMVTPVDVGEGGIQSVVDAMHSSSIDGGDIHTGRAGIAANNDIYLLGKDRSDSLIFRRLALENLTDFGGIEVVKMHIFEVALIVDNSK